MDSSDSITLLVMLFCIVMSAFFSATETAFSSLNRIRLKNMAENGNKRAALVLKMSDDYDKLLSTILVGNNIVNITLSSMATLFFVKMLNDNDLGATVSTVVITIVVLIFGEISPKSLAKETPEKFAMFSAPIMRVFLVVLTPVNFLFSQWKKLLNLLIRSDDTPSITEEELLTIVEEAEQDGGIDESESELIRSAIEFNDLQVVDIFTPRVDIEAVAIDADRQTIAEKFSQTGFSRLPIYEDTVDNIVGIIHLKDFYARVYNTDMPLASIIKPAVFITRTMKIYDLLRLLQKEKSHMAVISDEYGGTVGVVTMEDILEELVGEIWDEHDEVVEEFQKIAENRYRIVCSANLDEMIELFDLEEDEESDVTTVSGWVMEALGRIPSQGDEFDFENLHVIVTKTDGRRVLEIEVVVSPREEETEETP